MDKVEFITCLLFMYDRFLIGRRSLSTGLWASLAFLVRPDALFAIAPLFLYWLYIDWEKALRAIGLSVILVSPWLIWSTWYFGSPIPNSIVAKSAAYRYPVGHAAYFLLTFLATGTIGLYTSFTLLMLGACAGLILAALGFLGLARFKRDALVIAIYPLLYGVIMSWYNPAMFFSWYFLPLMPGTILLLIAAIWCSFKWKKQTKVVALGILGCILVGLPAILLAHSPNWSLARAREAAFHEACAYVEKRVRPTQWVLAPDIGILGWCLDQVNILDPVGLVSPEVLNYLTDLQPGQIVSPKLVADKQPDYVISLNQFVDPYLLHDPSFHRNYELIWRQDVKIVDVVQPLYVFRRMKVSTDE